MATDSSQLTTSRSARQRLLDAWERETATTLKVLRAYPADQSELQPHPRAKSARELAWMFTLEQGLVTAAIQDSLEVDISAGMPPAPATFEEAVSAFEASRTELLELLGAARDDQLAGTVRFFVAPNQMGDIPKETFLWFMLHDHIHHRGQFSVYLRMSGGKVPSIYGPSADEPWF